LNVISALPFDTVPSGKMRMGLTVSSLHYWNSLILFFIA